MASLLRGRSSKTPEERAESLLLAHLTKEQKETYTARGYFDFKGSSGGNFRLLNRQAQGRLGFAGLYPLVELDRNFNKRSYTARCVFPSRGTQWLPEGDILLGLKLAIEVNQENVGIGCRATCTAEQMSKLGTIPNTT